MAFVVTAIRKSGDEEFKGEYWHGETFQEHLELCKHQTTEPLFRKYLPKNATILEAGCGWCRWVIYLKDLGYDIIGLDCNHAALHEAKLYEPSIKVIRGDLFQTGFSDNTFDAILSLGVVEHAEDGPQESLKELKRILKPGGLLLLSVPANNLFRILLTNHLMRLRDIILRLFFGHELVFAEYRFSKTELRQFLAETGFQIIDFASDDLRPPLSIGLYADISFLTGIVGRKWRIGIFLRIVRSVLDMISPELACGGYAFVARALKKQESPSK